VCDHSPTGTRQNIRIKEESEDTHVLPSAEGGPSQRTEKKNGASEGHSRPVGRQGKTGQDIICIWASEGTYILLNALLGTSQHTER